MSTPESEIDVLQPPAFWVGAAGFSREQRKIIEDSLHHTSGADWRMCHFGEADAWLVNGAKCRVLSNGNLRVSPGMPTEAALNLDMQAADRPVAFATPIMDSNLEARCTFEADSPAGVQRALAQFDSWLRFARAQFLLGVQIVQRGALLRHGVFHVSYRDKLLAILDFWHGEAALCPHIDTDELEFAVWAKRPIGARTLPPGFIRSTPAQLAWNYVRRTDGNLLPSRYKSRPIYYRGSPRVPLSWLRDSHLRILKELSCESASFSELAQRTGCLSPQFDRDVACLFFAGAITTTESKAAPPAVACGNARRPVLAEHAVASAKERPDLTVPAGIGPRE
jgi:hypothetical protein